MDGVPGIANPQLGRDDGRPELAIRVDRPKAALLGLSVDRRRQHDPHERRRHAGGVLPRARQRISRSSCGCAKKTASGVEDINDVLISTPAGQVLQAKNLLTLDNQTGPDADSAQEPAAHHRASTPSRRPR